MTPTLPLGRRPRRSTGVALVCVAACVASALVPAASAAAAEPGGQSFVGDFRAGDRSTGAMFRWWWPSSVDADVAVRQLREVKAAGYAGVEIGFVMDGTGYVVDPDRFEYGDDRWRAAVRAVLAEANRIGLQVDLTLGGRWPAAVPGLDVSSDAASQELVTGDATVPAGGTFDAAAPAPPQRSYQDRTVENGVVTSQTKVSTPTLLTATATRCLADCDGANPQLDLTTVLDLDDAVSDGRIQWTAPDQGTWVVTAYWQRGTAQRNDAPFGTTVSPLSDPESRVVNHLSPAGAEAMLDFFGSLLDARTRSLLRANGGSLFEDSLELSASQLWTPELLDAFRDVNGYSLTRYLPVVAKLPPPGPFQPSPAVYAFSGEQAEIAERVGYDVEQTVDALYRDNHVRPVQAWAHRLGLTFRAQPYGEPIDLGAAPGYLDVTECETLGCSEGRFRTAAAGVALAGKSLLSSEMLPWGFGNLYGLTPAQVATGEVLPDGTERRGANRELGFGVNHLVFHGLPYPTVPPSADGTVEDDASFWPGFHAFSAFIGEAFGPRQPSWTMERDVSGYYARAQRALRAGTMRLDVAVLNTSLTDVSVDAAPLSAAGLTYGYVTPGSLAGRTVEDGRLAADGPAFQALVVGEGPVDLATARQVRRLAADGLTVVVVGDGPQRALGYAATPARAEAQDARVRRVFARVLAGPNAERAATFDDVAAALEADVQPETAVEDLRVQAVHRRAGDMDVYLLVNRSTADVRTPVSLAARGGQVPYLLDPWSGEVRPAGVWTSSGDRVGLELDVVAGSTRLVALAGRRFSGATVPSVHAVSTEALDASWSRHGLWLRADHDGSFLTSLSNGRTLRTTVTGVPAATRLAGWDLRLDEWLPGGPGDPSSLTRHRTHVIENVPLESWTEIEGIQDAVGVGAYTTEVQASPALARAGAVLDLGAISGSYQVYVNGRRTPTPDQLGARVDLGGALRPGPNQIEVRVASPLLNRLRVHRPAEFAIRPPTVNGLLGPVTLDPYLDVPPTD